MNSFSNKNNVLVIDNTKIHHDEEMINLMKELVVKYYFYFHTHLITIQ